MKKPTKAQKELLAELIEKKIKPSEVATVVKGLKSFNSWKKYLPVKIDFPDRHVKFGAFSDSHIGHSDYRPDILRKMIADGKRQGIEFWVNSGDTIEGMSGRDGHIYELTHLGASSQLDYFAKEFKLFRNTVYSIEAQNSHGGWFKSKGNMGLNIGEELAMRSKHYEFIGYDEQDLVLDNGFKIRLQHPGSGTAYALSYKGQKYIDSISGGKKPHMILTGHYHKVIYMSYRNIHYVGAGTLCNQTPFMRKVGTPAHVGYWIIDVNMHNKKSKGVERVTTQFVPFYE